MKSLAKEVRRVRKAARRVFVRKMMELNRYTQLDYVYNVNVLTQEIEDLRSII